MGHHRLAALARLLEAARQRYIARGEISGTLRLPAITEEERLAVAGLLSGYVKVRPGETLTLPLARPSRTSYVSWCKGSRVPLRFSRSGEPTIEEGYATHWIPPKAEAGKYLGQ